MKRFAASAAVLAAAFASTLVFGVAGSQAGLFGDLLGNLLSCSGYTYSQPFAQWGDNGGYFLTPGGSFEGSTPWSLSGGAQVVAGNEPFYLNSQTDSHSLLLPPGSSATTPAMCMAALSPDLRFVGRASGQGVVHVDVYASGVLGLVRLPTSANIQLGSSWAPSEQIGLLLQNVLALTNLGKTSIVFRFSPVGDSTAQIDDVYVDPCLHEG